MGIREEYVKVQEQMIQQRNLEGRKSSLQTQIRELEKKVLELSCKKDAEQRDVEKLQGRSLANFFYYVTGSMQHRLEKEKQEAYAAAVKYDAAVQELEAVKYDLSQINKALSEVRGAGERYQKLLDQRREELKISGSQDGEKLIQMEQRLAYLKEQKKEISEARTEGRSALGIAEAILSSLSHAENYGTWDLLGGGLIADMAKHSHLDDAQKKVEELQVRLRRFQTELTDVQIQTDMQVNIDGFLRFADYFFDGLFADWTVQNRIKDSKLQIASVVNKLKDAIRKLEAMDNSADAEIRSCTGQMDEIAQNSF